MIKKRKCCIEGNYTPTGRNSPTLHPHARAPRSTDAPTGYKHTVDGLKPSFKQDKSTTKAVLKRMKALGVIA